MHTKKVAVLASAALAASSVLVLSQPASAALTTRCTGEAGEVTVPGDLVVPRGRACVLTGTTVQGDVRVLAGADLVLDGATIGGDLTAVDDAFVDVLGSTVAGRVLGRDQFGLFLEDSAVAGALQQRSREPGDFPPFVYAFQTSAGSVDSRAGEVLLESSTTGDVRSVDGEYTDVLDTVVDGALTVRSNALGSIVCESEIYGDTLYRANSGVLQIGGSSAISACEGASYWGGDVQFRDNTPDEGSFDISNNIVAGDLTGQGNDPLPTGAGNRVRGEITLQFASAALAEAGVSEMSSQSLRAQSEAEAIVETRIGDLRAKVEERRGAAEQDAAATPDGQALVPGNG